MTNMKVILTVSAVVALAASPAMAKTLRRHGTPTPTAAPADTRAATQQLITPYAADLPQPAYRVHGLNPDFQIGAEK